MPQIQTQVQSPTPPQPKVIPGPYPIQFKGHAWAAVLLKLIGWKVDFQGLPGLQGIAIVYPHTSNWDFLTAMLCKWTMGLPVHFWCKDSLVKVPLFGRWLKWIGGVPIDRSSPRGVVGAMTEVFAEHQRAGTFLWLGLSPEGTRKRTDGWRSGFYQLAMATQLPLAIVRFDYGQKVLKFECFVKLTGNVDVDYAYLQKMYEGVEGFHIDNAAPIKPLPARDVQK
ncbi:MAG: 1-acyl-sn-glycerol-3-phosphate acyltransferase [Limnohabitans sp.]|jgi:1-acyl-sn-glycerol-3-phosphate acyltransferase